MCVLVQGPTGNSSQNMIRVCRVHLKKCVTAVKNILKPPLIDLRGQIQCLNFTSSRLTLSLNSAGPAPLTHSPLQPTRSAETSHGSHQRARGPAGRRVDFAAFDRPVNSVCSRGSQSEIMHADAHADTLPGIRAGDTGPCWNFARRNQKHGSSDLQSKARSIWRSVIQDDCLPPFFSCKKKKKKNRTEG